MVTTATHELSQRANTLAASAVLALHDVGTVHCQEVKCPVLPWLESNSDIQRTLAESFTRCIQSFWSARHDVIRRTWRAQSSADRKKQSALWLELRSKLSQTLANHLLQYAIDVDVDLHLTVEQHTGKLAAPQLGFDWLTWKNYQDVLKRNARELRPGDLGALTKERLAFSPDPDADNPWLMLKASRQVHLKNIKLMKGEHVLVSSPTSKVLSDKTPTRVRMPRLPVSAYHLLHEERGDQKLIVHLTLAGGRDLSLEVPVSIPRLDGEPSILFIDLGSTTSKMVIVHIPLINPGSLKGADFDGAIARALQTGIPLESSDHVTALEPRPTTDFIEQFKLPAYDKKQLSRDGEDALASWFERAARCFAASLAKKNRPLGKIFWSFPAVDGIAIPKLQEAIQRKAAPWMLGTPELVTEHEALRYRYENTLKILASAAEEQRKAHEDVKAENKRRQEQWLKTRQRYVQAKKDYDSKLFLKRWFSSEPEKPDLSKYNDLPVPELEAWHQKFLALSIRAELDEFIILDAGGFTLDVYSQVRGKSFGHSFKAGGQDLTSRVAAYIQANRGGQPLTMTDAEWRKIDLCNTHRKLVHNKRTDDTRSAGELAAMIASWTREIYEPSIEEGLRRGLHLDQGKVPQGIPLIFTGGGMKNPWLLELIEDKIRELGIKNLLINSESLTEEIESFSLNKPVLNRFKAITYGFARDKNMIDIRTDIIGGLIERSMMSGS